MRRHSRDPAKHLVGPLGRVSGRQHVAWSVTLQRAIATTRPHPPSLVFTCLGQKHKSLRLDQSLHGGLGQKTLSNDVSIHVQDSWHWFRPLVLCQRRLRNANYSTCAFTGQWMSHADSIDALNVNIEPYQWFRATNQLHSMFKLLKSP